MTMKVENMCIEVWAATDAQHSQAAKKPEEPAPGNAEPVLAEAPKDEKPAADGD